MQNDSAGFHTFRRDKNKHGLLMNSCLKEKGKRNTYASSGLVRKAAFFMLFLPASLVWVQGQHGSGMDTLWDNPEGVHRVGIGLRPAMFGSMLYAGIGGTLRLDYQDMKRSSAFLEFGIAKVMDLDEIPASQMPVSEEKRTSAFVAEGAYTFYFRRKEKKMLEYVDLHVIKQVSGPKGTYAVTHSEPGMFKRRIDHGIRLGAMYRNEPLRTGYFSFPIQNFIGPDERTYQYDGSITTRQQATFLFAGWQRKKVWHFAVLNKSDHKPYFRSKVRDIYVDLLYCSKLNFNDVSDPVGHIHDFADSMGVSVFRVPTQGNVNSRVGFRFGLSYQNHSIGKGFGLSATYEGGFLYNFANGIPYNGNGYWYARISIGVLFARKILKSTE